MSLPVLPSDILLKKKISPNATEIRSKLDITSLLKPWQEESKNTELIAAETINPIKEHQAKNIFPRIDPEKEIGLGNINKLKLKN